MFRRVVSEHGRVEVTGGGSMQLRNVRVLALAIAAFSQASRLRRAQITTGTVTGTVKDAQGGVIPGATVVLISEARGTKLAPGRDQRNRRLRHSERHADTYTVEVTMEAFKTLRRTGIQVSGGDRVGVPAADARSRRRHRRNRQRHRRSAAGPVAERRALVRGHHRADREPADRARQLHQPDRVHARRRRRRRLGRRHPPRRRRPEQHHDGRRLGDGHRQQRPDAAA